jgi:hypothetical protein
MKVFLIHCFCLGILVFVAFVFFLWEKSLNTFMLSFFFHNTSNYKKKGEFNSFLYSDMFVSLYYTPHTTH